MQQSSLSSHTFSVAINASAKLFFSHKEYVRKMRISLPVEVKIKNFKKIASDLDIIK